MALYSNATQLRSAMIKSLHGWWLSHCGDDVPGRAALEAPAIKELMPYLLVSDAEGAPFRVRYRFLGPKVIELVGRDFTGEYLDELDTRDSDEPWIDDYRQAFTTRKPVIGTSAVPSKFGASYYYEFGIFPLRNSGAEIAQFVGIEDYFNFRLLDFASEP